MLIKVYWTKLIQTNPFQWGQLGKKRSFLTLSDENIQYPKRCTKENTMDNVRNNSHDRYYTLS
jgi:hypothetical protein